MKRLESVLMRARSLHILPSRDEECEDGGSVNNELHMDRIGKEPQPSPLNEMGMRTAAGLAQSTEIPQVDDTIGGTWPSYRNERPAIDNLRQFNETKQNSNPQGLRGAAEKGAWRTRRRDRLTSSEFKIAPQLQLDENLMFPYESSNPCETCCTLVLEDFLPKYSSTNGYGCLKSQDSLGKLEDSVQEGCKFCALKKQVLLGNAANIEEAEKYFRTAGVNCAFSLRPSHTTVKGPLVVEVSTQLTRFGGDHALGLYTDRGDPAAARIQGRRLSRYADLETICYETKRTMDSDLASKKNDPDPELPKRVIDVGTSSDHSTVKVREVYESRGERSGRYICLSHRWATMATPFTTTIATLAERIDGVKLQGLTQTFRDAIAITRKLGVRYIWIDSLCILQDSKEDWEVESGKMGGYYRSSWLTIGAGMAGDGLFSLERVPPAYPYYKFSQASSLSSKQAFTVYFSEEPHKMPLRGTDDPNQSLLHSRGWTLQEEMLSDHFLSFEPTQVYFRGSERIHFECGYSMGINLWNSFGPRQLSTKGIWIRIVQDFSLRTLTMDDDKLPALSGLAHEYQKIWQDVYLAGLWKNELWKHLLWHAEAPRKALPYRAPSWSWASVDGPIAFTGTQFGDSCVELVEACVEPKGKDPLGQVKSGSIIIHAHMVQLAVWSPDRALGEERCLYLNGTRCNVGLDVADITSTMDMPCGAPRTGKTQYFPKDWSLLFPPPSSNNDRGM